MGSQPTGEENPRHVIVIAEAVPEKSYAASLTMYRHMVERPGFRVHAFCPPDMRKKSRGVFDRILDRIRNTRLHSWIASFDFFRDRRSKFENNIPSPDELNAIKPVVLTLAHANSCWIAQRYARKHNLPLIVRFDDWWPDIPDVRPSTRKKIESAFRELYRESDCAICISDEMKQELGDHRNVHVVRPIPGQRDVAAQPIEHSTPLRACYMGNMYDYGPMLERLVEASANEDEVVFEFRGGHPNWSTGTIERMQQAGRLHGYADGPEFERWVESFHVYLVVMFFEPEYRIRVDTCFATKLAEYCSLGRPVVIWAPESAAIVKWSRDNDAAICVTDPAPEALLQRLREVASQPEQLARFGSNARQCYETELNPASLQKAFVNAVDSVTDSLTGPIHG
ncbi:MAG: glycosyltransferase [Planctomycetota bacterium]